MNDKLWKIRSKVQCRLERCRKPRDITNINIHPRRNCKNHFANNGKGQETRHRSQCFLSLSGSADLVWKEWLYASDNCPCSPCIVQACHFCTFRFFGKILCLYFQCIHTVTIFVAVSCYWVEVQFRTRGHPYLIDLTSMTLINMNTLKQREPWTLQMAAVFASGRFDELFICIYL